MSDEQSSLKVSSKREKDAQRREIFRWLALLYEAGLRWEPDLAERRKEFVDQILKQKGRKV